VKRQTKLILIYALLSIHSYMILQPVILVYAQKSIKTLQKKLLEKNIVETLVFSENDFKKLQFIEPEEFYFQTFLYDVKSIAHQKEKVIVKAIKDHRETHLLSFLTKKNEKKQDKLKQLSHFFSFNTTYYPIQQFIFFQHKILFIFFEKKWNIMYALIFEILKPPKF